jgi:hypothetical protein
MKTTARLVLAAALALLCAQAQAQTMYRCGKVYQDRPCDAGVKGKAVGSTGVQAAPQAAVDAECAQRGKDSNKIVWAREGGASEQRLLLEARSGAEQRFISDVYRRPGSPSTVQAAVQADCVAEKEREKEAAGLAAAAAAAALLKGLSPPAETPANPDAQAQARRKNELAQQHAAGDAARRTENCARYRQQLDNLRSQERIGAPAAETESLNAQRRELRELMGKAGC